MPSRQALSSDSEPKITDIFIAITTLAALIILFAILYFLYYLWYSLVHRARTSPFDSNAPLVKLQRFSYRELKWATQGFSESSSIGKGGSGSVFRGKLKNGKWVAVKLLDCASFQTEREFQNELQILGGIKSPLVVSLLGYSVEKSKRLVVYEYMPNRSLQESLFSETNLGLNWSRRFDIILDVAKALAFLHLECNPPVVHGDVKPSNVLLDSELRAKLSDFGLSRLKVEGEFGVDLFSQDLGKSQDLSGNLGVGTGGTQTPGESHDEVDFALALQASSSSKNTAKMVQNVRALGLMNSMNYNAVFESDEKSRNLKGKEVENSEFGNYDDELSSSIDHSKELGGGDDNVVSKTQWGRDWWWRQDGSGELCSKDYVMEWIGSQICPSANPDWDEHNNKSPNRKPSLENSTRFTKFEEAKEPELGSLKKGFELESQTKKPRKMKEWWKEEHLDELSEKKKKKKKKKTNSHSIGSDIWSGDLFSRELSSTTSMRGTLCYVAPEFGGCGYLMEKADIYSLGVLILVIVSGRRPLHVLNSPMKLEKANLISWCKQLAHSGNILELVDERLRDEYNKDQASLCINLALACLQRMPELRPDIGDIVKILRGEMELPPLPFEFSPSPPSKMFNRSRRRQKSNAESASK
ncbi:PREDICTED: putative receptor-like protein kinase At1g80870 isoform X2 [Ipomoea nil]|uniref:putative receptor-like protein kinase At1g80870 isoform X2 n=1 Tax=Ipomoea nil TaxID=35883 RepID=UPI000900E991|nr:PREDICTED: putative receptor-like protein kinase At1g80870 isoform X2 [Ipomoea nil]